jgi:hypothetical protein
MVSKALVTSLLSGATAGAIVSAIWGHISKLLLQKREEKSKERLASLEAELKANFAKIESDLRLSQNLLQAKIDRSVFVTKAHFDTEFEAMKQVFGLLAKVSLYINGLRPMVGISPKSETYQEMRERLEDRRRTLGTAYDALLNEAEAKLPFYSAELYDAVEECQRAAWSEFNSIQTSGDPLEDEGLEEGERNRARFSKGYRRAAEIIRDRISRLAILPG